ANAFRSDIHQAISAAAADAPLGEGAFLRLELPAGQRIEYRREDGMILRVLLDGERTVSREAFVFPRGIELASKKDGPGLVVLSITSRPGEMPSEDSSSQPNSYAVPVNLHIEAALNRDPSFTRAP